MSSATWSNGVVVGVDGSTGGMHALDWAVDTAVRRRTRLRLVHAYTTPMSVVPSPLPVSPPDALAAAETTVHRMVDHVRDRAPELDVYGSVRRGDAASVLIEAERGSDLLVVGRRGLGRLERLALGSVSSRVASRAAGTVAVVPEREEGATDGRIVVGLDGSSEPAAVLELAYEEASLRDLPLAVVHAWEPSSGLAMLAEEDWTTRERLVAAARPRIEDLVAPWAHEHPEVHTTVDVVTSAPVAALLERTTAADLAVLGGRRHSRTVGLLMGSVADLFVRRAECPVLVVHHARER